MPQEDEHPTTLRQRRRILLAASAGALAGGAAMVLRPASVIIAHPRGEPLAVDLEKLPEGRLQTVEWRGKPVWVLRRSAASIAALANEENELSDPASVRSLQPPACRNRLRSLRPDIFVAIGLCTHQGCTPALSAAGSHFLCPCHTSKYDLAGRVFKAGPAPLNLVVPAYRFAAANRLIVGEDA